MLAAVLSCAIASALEADLQHIVDRIAARYNTSVSLAAQIGKSRPLAVAAGVTAPSSGRTATTSDRYAWGSVRHCISIPRPLGYGTTLATRAQPLTQSSRDRHACSQVTKTITGAAIMRLVADGKLSLEDPAHIHVNPMLAKAGYPYASMEELFSADRWSVPPPVLFNASAVTIRHLLSMTSGVPDYDTDAYRHLQYSHPTVGFSPLDILDYVHGPLMFKPGGPIPSPGGHHHHGSGMNYCSVNFILLGLVLANAAGSGSWAAYDQSSILPPTLRKTVTFAGADTQCSITNPVHGIDRQSVAAPFDVSSINCLGGWTAGNVIMDATAAANWTMALFGPDAEVLPASALKQMLPTPAQHYGLAMFNFDQRYANGTAGEAYGHLGDTCKRVASAPM